MVAKLCGQIQKLHFFADKLIKNNHKVFGVSREFIPYLNKNEQMQQEL